MKVCLLYPTWTASYGMFAHFARRASTWPPLILVLLAAVFEREGHEGSIIDGEAEQLSQDDMVRAAIGWKPDLIGLTATSLWSHLS